MSTSVYTVHAELNNYTLYRYRTSTADSQLNTVKQQHPSTATSLLTTQSPHRSLSARQLSERIVYKPLLVENCCIVKQRVTTKKSSGFFYFAAEAWNYAQLFVLQHPEMGYIS
jgi:hypothetical protein